MPAGTFSNVGYDPEDSLASYTAYQNIFSPTGTTVHNQISVRGELLGQAYTPDFDSQHNPLSYGWRMQNSVSAANGYLDPVVTGCGVVDTWDVRVKMPITSGQGCGDLSSDNSQGYDTAGRLVSGAVDWETENGNFTIEDHSGSYTKSYDAENRLISQNLNNYPVTTPQYGASSGCPGDYNVLNGGGPHTGTTATASYAWNVDEHPWLIDGSPIIWSDDAPLVVLKPDGTLKQILVDDRATLWPGYAQPMVVHDRDLSGMLVSWHDSTGVGRWTPLTEATLNCDWSSVPNGTSTMTPSGLEPRPDGIWDGYNTIQGVRNYDPTIGHWTTPDPYGGSVHDPASQQPYMWNRNNPNQYSDPTGFDPLIPREVWHPAGNVQPKEMNPWAEHQQDVLKDIFLGGLLPAGIGAGKDFGATGFFGGEWLTKGTVFGLVVSALWVEIHDKGIDAGYYAQTLYRANGTATTTVVYKPGEQASAPVWGVIQIINYDDRGGWVAITVFLDEKGNVEKSKIQHGRGVFTHTPKDFASYQLPWTPPAGVGMKG
jgi:RHS repeat-associated protein